MGYVAVRGKIKLRKGYVGLYIFIDKISFTKSLLRTAIASCNGLHPAALLREVSAPSQNCKFKIYYFSCGEFIIIPFATR